MANIIDYEARYREHFARVSEVDEKAWQFEKMAKRYRMRAAVAKALLHLAVLLVPPTQHARPA